MGRCSDATYHGTCKTHRSGQVRCLLLVWRGWRRRHVLRRPQNAEHEARTDDPCLRDEWPAAVNGAWGSLRLRCENQLGFKQVKWIRAIEFVDDFSRIGSGEGGYNEDHEFYGYRMPI